MRPRKSIFLVLCLAFAPALFAAQRSSAPIPSDQELLSRYTPVEIADYRESIRQTFIVGRELVGAANNPTVQKMIEQRLQLVDKLSDVDVARLKSYGADFSELHDALVAERDFIRVPAAGDGRKRSLSNGLPDAQYSFCGADHKGAAGLVVFQAALTAAKGLWSLADRGCDQVLVIAGEGGNGSLACIAADTALTIAQVAFDALIFCENDIDSAEINGSYRRLDHIHTDLANLQSSSDTSQNTIVSNDNSNATVIQANDNANRKLIIDNDNANRVAIIGNDNVNRDAIITVDNANRDAIVANDNTNRNLIIANDNANRDLIIADAHRLAIEQSLAANAGTPLALFELPAPNGFIDLARSIVRQTIDNMKAANQNVFQAESFYTQAVNAISAGLFKDAFHQLQRSYQEAAK
jgi:hypothetical protein